MFEDDELIILCFGVHAVKGLDIFRFKDGGIGVIEILLPEYLHDDNNLIFIRQSSIMNTYHLNANFIR